jgi:hypothetical protein
MPPDQNVPNSAPSTMIVASAIKVPPSTARATTSCRPSQNGQARASQATKFSAERVLAEDFLPLEWLETDPDVTPALPRGKTRTACPKASR